MFNRLFRSVALAAPVLLILPLGAQAFSNNKRLDVVPLNGVVFEVVGGPGTAATEYWCAAGEYAFDQGARGADRIYVVAGRIPSVSTPGAQAVHFTLDPAAAGITPLSGGLSLSVTNTGFNRYIESARQYCRRVFRRL